jgi:hypothetical protein
MKRKYKKLKNEHMEKEFFHLLLTLESYPACSLIVLSCHLASIHHYSETLSAIVSAKEKMSPQMQHKGLVSVLPVVFHC